MGRPCPYFSVVDIPADALLRLGHLFNLPGKPRHEPETHGKQQGKCRNDLSEQIHELVRGHDRVKYGNQDTTQASIIPDPTPYKIDSRVTGFPSFR